ncbi:tRNA-binding protein [Gluconobacter kondonii]|uniref:tRNA-binding protein n=1 Tax=Gluconobacter kondonii TaxID=941463 RepID=UPI001B8AF093|nr:tRNA-binding protein [Gluconobacter kondonii]
MTSISFDDFTKIDICVGTIVEVNNFPEARKPAWKLKIDFGSKFGIKTSSAQITELYTSDDLIGRQVACVVNLAPRQIGPFVSEVLTLGFPDIKKNVVLVEPERQVPNGSRLF